MDWPVEAFWVWWSRQPETMAADAQRRHQAWQRQKVQNRIAHHEEKLFNGGMSHRRIQRLRILAGVTKDDIAREASMAH